MGKAKARGKTAVNATRRTSGLRTRGRSERVVRLVLQAVAEELGRGGYAELRVEDVAARSGVNKTTIYRRWPSKAELVAAAIRQFAEAPKPPSTGSLRRDLIALLEHMAARVQTPSGMGIVRTIQMERYNPELEAVTREIKAEQWKLRRAVVEQGIARGELPLMADAELVTELLFAPVLRRITLQRKVDASFVRSTVDLVLAGARADLSGTPRVTRSSDRSSRRRRRDP